jgi:DNA-binding NarL/FixJ family response regulator
VSVRVAVADDAVILREGLARLLDEAGFEVAGLAADADELRALVERTSPDVAIVDIRMPPTHTDEGLRAAATIRAELPRTGVLVLSQYVNERYALQLLADSADGVGYLLKQRVMEPDGIAAAVRDVAAGGSVLDPEVVTHMLERRRSGGPIDTLTEREHAVLASAAEGRSNRAIARELELSDHTVERCLGSIFTKLELPDAAEGHRRVLAVLTYLRGQES